MAKPRNIIDEQASIAFSQSNERYRAFMEAYVKRINESTLRVKYGGVRIGKAKYSRLAQINLKSRIITFSRFAIENVPERGRRYLVIHELAHVKEPSHNRNFWNIVSLYEPDYKQIDKMLERAFARNVKEHQIFGDKINAEKRSGLFIPESFSVLPKNDELNIDDANVLDILSELKADDSQNFASERGEEFLPWHHYEHYENGIVSGGSDIECDEEELI